MLNLYTSKPSDSCNFKYFNAIRKVQSKPF